MNEEYTIPKKIQYYRRQIMLRFKANKKPQELLELIETSNIHVYEFESFDNGDAWIITYDIVFFSEEELWVKIETIGKKSDFEDELAKELRETTRMLDNEGINRVYIQLADPTDKNYIDAIQPNAAELGPSEVNQIWGANQYKLFISHRDTAKNEVHDIARALTNFGIKCFVAHDDITPNAKWQDEIVKALSSMDACLVYITDDFDSPWTNQEVGFALSRGVEIITIKAGNTDPKGFLSVWQAIHKLKYDNLGKEIVTTLLRKEKSRSLVSAIIRGFERSMYYDDAGLKFELLKLIPNFSEKEISQLVKAYNSNNQIYGALRGVPGLQFSEFLNGKSNRNFKEQFRTNRNSEIVEIKDFGDDIPF